MPSRGIIEGRFSLRENQLQNLGIILSIIGGIETTTSLLDRFIPPQYRLLVLCIALMVIAIFWLCWAIIRKYEIEEKLKESSKKNEELEKACLWKDETIRKSHHLMKTIIETITKLLGEYQNNKSPTWRTTKQAKEFERNATHEIWVCTSDLRPDTGEFLRDPILLNLQGKKKYFYLFDDSESKRFKSLQDSVHIEEVKRENRLCGRISPVQLSDIQLVILDAEYNDGKYLKTYLYLPWLTGISKNDTIEIEDENLSKELALLFKTFWNSLVDVPWV